MNTPAIEMKSKSMVNPTREKTEGNIASVVLIFFLREAYYTSS